jgi:hypothetical protein
MKNINKLDTPGLLRFLRTANVINGLTCLAISVFSVFGPILDLALPQALLAGYCL